MVQEDGHDDCAQSSGNLLDVWRLELVTGVVDCQASIIAANGLLAVQKSNMLTFDNGVSQRSYFLWRNIS